MQFAALGIPDFAQQVAMLLNDYDPELTLERLPDRHPWLLANPDKPYAVIHRPLGKPEYVFESYSAAELGPKIIADILRGDMNKHGRDLSEFDAHRWAANLLAQRSRADTIASGNDRMDFALRVQHDRGKKVIRG